MLTFASIPEAVAAARAYTAPATVAPKLAGIADMLSPVDVICRMGEALYANRADLDNAGKALCAGLAAFASMNGWHGLGDARGTGIVQAMRRDMGETSPTGTWPDPKDDPAPDAAFTA